MIAAREDATVKRRPTFAALQEALDCAPDDADKAAALGTAFYETEKLEAALVHFQRASALDHKRAEYHQKIGQVLMGMHRLEEAVQAFEHARDRAPERWELLSNIGDLYLRLDRKDEARSAYMKLAAQSSLGFAGLGKVLTHNASLTEIWEDLSAVTSVLQKPVDSYRGAALALGSSGRHEEARVIYDQVLRIAPDDTLAHYYLGALEFTAGNWEASLQYNNRALTLDSSNPLALFAQMQNLHIEAKYDSIAKLLRAALLNLGGHTFAKLRAWSVGAEPSVLYRPEWQGQSLEGKVIRLLCRGGLGYTIQHVRFTKALKELGATVILECQEPLCEVMRTVEAVDVVTSKYEPCPEFDYDLELDALWLRLGLELQDIGNYLPYIDPPAAAIAMLRRRTEQTTMLKVGVVWQGSQRLTSGAHTCRSLPLAKLRPLADVPGVCLYSLQYGHGVEQITPDLGFSMVDLGGLDFYETAAAVMSLDLVVSVDTSVAHLAASCGKPVHILLPYTPWGLWLYGINPSPWYPKMLVVRQVQPGDWDTVIEETRSKLQRWKSTRRQ